MRNMTFSGLTRSLLAFFVWNPERSWKSCATAAIFACVALGVGLAFHPPFKPLPKLASMNDGHADVSLSEGLAFGLCGRYGVTTGADSIFRPGDIKTEEPYKDILRAHFGSVDKYCTAAHSHFLNNENSLFLLDAVFISLRPDGSLKSLANMHRVFRCLWLAASMFLIALCGVGLLPLIFISWVATDVLNLFDPAFFISLYPMLSLLLLISSAVIPGLFFALRSKKVAHAVLIAVGLGLVAGFIYNWRTSYGFMIVVQAIVGLIAYSLWRNRTGSRIGIRRFIIGITGMIAGFVAFQLVFIVPLEQGSSGKYNYPSHVIWHPIVLGLANPPNAFAQSQGIEWNDSVGPMLAHRVDPNATYLGPTYERALRSYYFGLWKRFPDKMLAIYGNKLIQFAQFMPGLGASVAKSIEKAIIPNGVIWFGWVLAMALAGLCVLPLNMPLALYSITLATGLACASVEQVIVSPSFYLQYQGSLLVGFSALLATMLTVLAAVFLHFILRSMPEKTG